MDLDLSDISPENKMSSFRGYEEPSDFSFFLLPKNTCHNSLSLSFVKTNKRTHAHTKPHTKEESARASLAGYTTTTRGSLANARGKESVVAANST